MSVYEIFHKGTMCVLTIVLFTQNSFLLPTHKYLLKATPFTDNYTSFFDDITDLFDIDMMIYSLYNIISSSI